MEEVKTQFYTFAETADDSFRLQSGQTFGPITLAYETYGTLSPGKDNAILIFHALSGSQHAAGVNRSVPGVGGLWTEECHIGWWDDFIGPGKAFDTNRYFVICANYLGGCYGSTGPASIDPADGKPYGGRFPRIRLNDILDSQMKLLKHLGIQRLHAVAGGSLGGILSLLLAIRYPESVNTVIPIAAGMEVTILQRIHNFEQIFAIEEDPNFRGGHYYDGPRPDKGLALARMISHKTFVSLSTMENRARHELLDKGKNGIYELSHPVESYLLHQGQKFVARFDANTYLRIMDAWQHFDLLKDTGADSYRTLFRPCLHQRFMIFSIDSDVCYYPDEQQEMAKALRNCGVPCQHITVHSEKGHDAFLLEPALLTPHLEYTLQEKW